MPPGIHAIPDLGGIGAGTVALPVGIDNRRAIMLNLDLALVDFVGGTNMVIGARAHRR